MFLYIILRISIESCPKGDDPLTPIGDYRTITITTSATSGTFGGTFKLTFNGDSFNFPADPSSWDSTACEASFAGLLNVKRVSCSTPVTSGTAYAQYTVQFVEWPILPVDTNIYENDGNPAATAFVCDPYSVSGTVDATCTIADVSANNLPGIYTKLACLMCMNS